MIRDEYFQFFVKIIEVYLIRSTVSQAFPKKKTRQAASISQLMIGNSHHAEPSLHLLHLLAQKPFAGLLQASPSQMETQRKSMN